MYCHFYVHVIIRILVSESGIQISGDRTISGLHLAGNLDDVNNITIFDRSTNGTFIVNIDDGIEHFLKIGKNVSHQIVSGTTIRLGFCKTFIRFRKEFLVICFSSKLSIEVKNKIYDFAVQNDSKTDSGIVTSIILIRYYCSI